ncbi:MAG TPA: hypothetical protein VKZ95_08180 [Sphingobacteriaceae bacterium]|nr:hypothetical protein [Sphingobacteriaceae bacterium]
MKTTEQHIEDLHFEHKLWQSEVSFYIDELKIYKEQIEHIGRRDITSEISNKVKFFEDQFHNSDTELESLHREIAAHEHDLAAIEKNNLEGSESGDEQKHSEMRDQFKKFQDKYTNLKNEFRSFFKDLK